MEDALKEARIEVVSIRAAEAREEELINADTVILGAPTYNHNLYAPIRNFLFRLEKLPLKGKVGAAFEAYGWSCESVVMIGETMEHIFQMNVVNPGLKLTSHQIEGSPHEYAGFAKRITSTLKQR